MALVQSGASAHERPPVAGLSFFSRWRRRTVDPAELLRGVVRGVLGSEPGIDDAEQLRVVLHPHDLRPAVRCQPAGRSCAAR